jgi:hypothetical protein
MEEEIELNFRLDEHGRTAYVPPALDEPNEENEGDSLQQKQQQPQGESDVSLDYQPKTIMTNLAGPPAASSTDHHHNHCSWIDDLLFDCEITDCGLMPRTFWVPVDGKPRCSLEQFALNVFHHHVPMTMKYDPAKSGAEWWVQIRPSPEGTGRYSMHDNTDDTNDSSMTKSGISFHWDKDEDLRLLTGGNTYIHPHLSTVTYLTDFGCPTLALNCRIHNLTGDWLVPGNVDGEHLEPTTEEPTSVVTGFVSWPKAGKHMSFDGRFLHAAPPDLMEPGAFDKQVSFAKGENEQKNKILHRRHRRVTFLVNIWLNFHPFEVKPFPDTMIDKLSGSKNELMLHLLFEKDRSTHATTARQLTVTDSGMVKKKNASTSNDDTTDQPVTFCWPLGDCDSEETLVADIPLHDIRKEASHGGNVRIAWEPQPAHNGEPKSKPIFGLYRGTNSTEVVANSETASAAKRQVDPSTACDDETTRKQPRCE